MELDDFDDDPVRDFCCLYISFVGIVVFVDSVIEFVFFFFVLVKVASAGDKCWEFDMGRQWQNSDGGVSGALIC